ncbi:alpha/beta hydrolase, partial [bacterium]|nr:alpha/beta hydrolase [bacterium]
MKTLLFIIIIMVLIKLLVMFMEQKSLYYPSPDIPATPANINLPYEEVYFRAQDGETLHAWFIPAKNPIATVLYCHGNAGNISHRLHRVKFFHDMGINLLIFDYRGYGK